MGRTRAKKTTDLQTEPAADETAADVAVANDPNDVFAEAAAQARQAEQPAESNGHAAAHEPNGNGHAAQHAPAASGHAATVERKPYTRPADPFDFVTLKAGENRVQLLKSEGEGAWVIRFAHNPNLDKGPEGETYSKENPHPVLKMLKEEGHRWGFDGGDGKGGWGKRFSGDAYGADHLDARRVLQKASEMIGGPKQEMGVTVQR